MKILEVIQDNRFGGIAARSLSAAGALRERGVDFVFVLPTDDGDVSERCRKFGFRTIRVALRRPNPRRPVQTLLWLTSFPLAVGRLCRIVRQERPDVVHANGMICLQAAVAGLLSRVPLIWHLAGTNMYPRLFCRAVMGSLGRCAYKIFIAEGVRRYFLQDAPVSSREAIIHEPADLEQIERARAAHVKGSFRSQIGVPPQATLICTIANLTSLKGIDVLLQAAVRIRREYPDTYFAVVGKKLATQQRFLARLERDIEAGGMSSHFLLTGYRDDIYQVLQDGDLFVLPSLSEGTPISILEAMAVGLPVIATRVGGIPEQIEDGRSGLLVPPGDPERLAEAVVHLLSAPNLRAELARQAQKRVREQFSLDTFCEKFLAVLDQAQRPPDRRRCCAHECWE